MEDYLYNEEERKQLNTLLDEFFNEFPQEEEIIAEAVKFDIFSEAINGGSIKRAVQRAQGRKNRMVEKVSNVVDSGVDTALDGNKKEEMTSIREDIMRGRGKPSTILKRAIKCALIGGVTGNAAIGLIVFVLSTLRRKALSEKERDKIYFEMKQELDIIDEKIKDAESDGNKKLKYQYMRLKTELKRNIHQFQTKGKLQQTQNSKIRK